MSAKRSREAAADPVCPKRTREDPSKKDQAGHAAAAQSKPRIVALRQWVFTEGEGEEVLQSFYDAAHKRLILHLVDCVSTGNVALPRGEAPLQTQSLKEDEWNDGFYLVGPYLVGQNLVGELPPKTHDVERVFEIQNKEGTVLQRFKYAATRLAVNQQAGPRPWVALTCQGSVAFLSWEGTCQLESERLPEERLIAVVTDPKSGEVFVLSVNTEDKGQVWVLCQEGKVKRQFGRDQLKVSQKQTCLTSLLTLTDQNVWIGQYSASGNSVAIYTKSGDFLGEIDTQSKGVLNFTDNYLSQVEDVAVNYSRLKDGLSDQDDESEEEQDESEEEQDLPRQLPRRPKKKKKKSPLRECC